MVGNSTKWGISTVGRTNSSFRTPTPKHPIPAGCKRWSEIQPNGALAQLVARYIRIVEVSGSNPLCSTTKKPLKLLDFKGFFLWLLESEIGGIYDVKIGILER